MERGRAQEAELGAVYTAPRAKVLTGDSASGRSALDLHGSVLSHARTVGEAVRLGREYARAGGASLRG